MSAVRAMACSTQGEVFAAALCGSCDCCMLCAHTALLQPPSAELLFNHSPPPADGLRAALAERCTMHGHNFSAPAAQSDELRPAAAPKGLGASRSILQSEVAYIYFGCCPPGRLGTANSNVQHGPGAHTGFSARFDSRYAIATGRPRAMQKHSCIRAPKGGLPHGACCSRATSPT